MSAIKPAYAAASLVWMFIIFWLSSIPELRSSLPTFWDSILRKGAHVAEYAILYILLSRSVTAPWRYGAAAVIGLLYALSDEWHQVYVAGRHGSLIDAAIDALGLAVGLYITKKSDPKI